MRDGKRRAERAAGVARRRLHENLVEAAVAKHLAIGDAIQGYAAGKTEIAKPGFGRERTRQAQHDLFRHRLDRGRQIHVALLQRLIGTARRAAEHRIETATGHRQAGAIGKIIKVQPE